MAIQIIEPTDDITRDEDEIVLGIDLGTTNSLVGVIKDGAPLFFGGKKRLHPSIVNFDKSGNIISVCEHVKNAEAVEISSVKRLMGKGFADIKDVLADLHFMVDDATNDKESILIKIADKKYSPIEVSSEILKYLKNIAEVELGLEVKKAVITVPAYFDEAAKNAARAAAKLANLEVLRLISEPTAAAIAYSLDQKQDGGRFLVYDLGGGTFDVSLLKLHKSVFRVLGVSGDAQLGGDDIDMKVVSLIKSKLAEQNVILNSFQDLVQSHETLKQVRHDEEMADESRQLKAIAKNIKEQLSSRESYSTNFVFRNKEVSFTLTRDEFEAAILSMIERTVSIMNKLLLDLDISYDKIAGIVLVGGSTRIPLIKKVLKERAQTEVLTAINPDEAVAIGAIHVAHGLGSRSGNLLLDVVPLSLGIETMGGLVEKIIYRNSPTPTSSAVEFTNYADNQTGIKLHVVQGEATLAKDCRSLGEFEIKMPKAKAGSARIVVTFKLDVDGLLTVSSFDKITSVSKEIEFKPSYGLGEQQIKQLIVNNETNL